MSKLLKPCPFCGKSDRVHTCQGAVECARCQVIVEPDVWQRRPIEDSHEFIALKSLRDRVMDKADSCKCALGPAAIAYDHVVSMIDRILVQSGRTEVNQ